MIKSITVINKTGEKLTIELGAPETTGLWIKSIKGIGPGKANINTTELASSDGGLYNSARSEIRNITLTLGFMPYTHPTEIDPVTGKPRTVSVEEVRRNTYKWFAKKRPISFIVNTDLISLVSYGYVESNEPDIFNKQETTSISIICPDPNMYMYDSSEGIDFSSTADGFEFPLPDGYENPINVDEYDPPREVYTLTTDETIKAGKEYFRKVSDGYYVPIDDFYQETADETMQVGKTYYELVSSEYVPTEDISFQQGKTYYELIGILQLTTIPANTFYERHSVTELATIIPIITKSMNYDGEIEVGVSITIYILGTVTGLSIYKVDPQDENYYEAINIDDSALALIPDIGSGGLQGGDEIRICTIVGKKSAILIRSAKTYNIMNALGRNPAWFKLDQGLNLFSYAATFGAENANINISYSKAYEGV